MATADEVHAAMQQIADFGGDHGVMEQAGFTFPILVPFQAARLSKGELVDPQEYAYGPHPRQKLDVYLPKSNAATSPVILHAYGGGFALGGKRAFPGVYQNVGTFFSQQGFIHVVMDYRLLEHGAKYPSGPEDVSLALQWLAEGNIKQADLNNVFLLGESAGGMHMANLLWDTVDGVKAASSIPGLKIRGLAFLSSVYHFESADELPPPAITYYGSAESALDKSLLKLRKTSQDDTPILAIYGTHDPKKTVLSGLEALKAHFASKEGSPAPFELCEAKMHNHISLPVTVGLGHGSDDWAYDMIKWMKKYKA